MNSANFPKVDDIKVLVVGDMMLDQYWFGDVARISPEAPVPIVNVKSDEKRCGGAANVALNIASMGAKCRIISVAGDDENGDIIESMLKENDIDVCFTRSKKYKTILKQRIISRNQQLLRLDFEDRPIDEILTRCMDSYEKSIDWADVIILSDYGKGGLDHVSVMINKAKDKNKTVIIDPKGSDYSKYTGASLITPNMSEFQQVVGVVNDKNMDQKAFDLIKSLNLDSLLITMSEKGMKLYDKLGNIYFSPAKAQEVYDVSGAGDTVIATVAMMYAAGVDKQKTLSIANAAASVVVAKLGTATATEVEINDVLNNG